jgi:hypothetical protein
VHKCFLLTANTRYGRNPVCWSARRGETDVQTAKDLAGYASIAARERQWPVRVGAADSAVTGGEQEGAYGPGGVPETGAVQALAMKETKTEVKIESSSDILFENAEPSAIVRE